MDPLTIMMLGQAIPAAINIGKSISQGVKANRLAKTERPGYDIPESVKQQLNQARYLAGMTELPGQNLMLDRLGQTTSRGIAELKDVSSNPSTLASNVAKLYSGQMDATNDIGIMAGQQWLKNQMGLKDTLGNYGEYEDKEWLINKMQPYENAKAAEAALREGAFRNLYSAGANIGAGVSGMGNVMLQEDLLGSLSGATEGTSGAANAATLGATAGLSSPTTMTEAINVPITPAVQQDSSTRGMMPENQKMMLRYLLKDLVR